MKSHRILQKITLLLCILSLTAGTWLGATCELNAVDFPTITVTFDPTDESVIVEGVQDLSPDGPYNYSLEGYLNYDKERVETFCYGPRARAYDIPEKMAYIFNWKDHEFILPCSGEYKFTCYMTALYWDNDKQKEVKEKGPKTTITITLTKQDESTNWGPGLPNTTIETYTLKEIMGKNKTIEINEPEYSWNIHGTEIIEVPDANISLKVVTNPDPYSYGNVQEFFGSTLAYMLGIEHHGPFGFTAHLKYNMGADYIGKFAHLFYVVGDGTFVYMGSALVEADGYVVFPFDHASEYIIAVTDEEYTGQELNPKVEEPVVDEPTVEESEVDSPEMDDTAAGEGADVQKDESIGDNVATDDKTENSGSDVMAENNPDTNTDMTGQEKEDATSIGIIGGADGPTAIFVAGSIGSVWLWVIIGIIAVAALVTVVILLKKKK